jgi:hypothetical protein
MEIAAVVVMARSQRQQDTKKTMVVVAAATMNQKFLTYLLQEYQPSSVVTNTAIMEIRVGVVVFPCLEYQSPQQLIVAAITLAITTAISRNLIHPSHHFVLVVAMAKV